MSRLSWGQLEIAEARLAKLILEGWPLRILTLCLWADAAYGGTNSSAWVCSQKDPNSTFLAIQECFGNLQADVVLWGAVSVSARSWCVAIWSPGLQPSREINSALLPGNEFA